MPGNLFVVSAPSGAGKTTLVRKLVAADPAIRLSVSYTTRPPRPGEVNGKDYQFVDRDRFEAMLERGEFLESAEVFGNRYGTSQRWVREQMAAGTDILLEIDWQGAQQVRKLVPQAIGIFILPPSMEALLQRLNSRAQDGPEVIARRLAGARDEIGHMGEFDYVIINNKLDEALQDLLAVVRAERLTLAKQARRHQDLINRFK
ncbi:MAG: guanylate kinase [Betaproteobacteria bacterium]|nr:guanylate kinase [Betaproteobacteria bacterium]